MSGCVGHGTASKPMGPAILHYQLTWVVATTSPSTTASSRTTGQRGTLTSTRQWRLMCTRRRPGAGPSPSFIHPQRGRKVSARGRPWAAWRWSCAKHSSSLARMEAPTAAIGRMSHIAACDPFPWVRPSPLRPDRSLQDRSQGMPGPTLWLGAATQWMRHLCSKGDGYYTGEYQGLHDAMLRAPPVPSLGGSRRPAASLWP